MHSPSDGIEAAEPTSKLLMSNSTTTTTLASNNNSATTTANNRCANFNVNNNAIKLELLGVDGKCHEMNNAGNDTNSKMTELDLLNRVEQEIPTRAKDSILKQDNHGDGDIVTTTFSDKKESNLVVGLKLLVIFSTLYFFMWSSSILSQAFNLTSYHYTGHFIRTSGFLQNPLIGLMVGIITTVVFQSSGAVTSVLVTIVGSGVLSVRQSIPIIMGANLGTSVTNTVVSLIVYRKKQNFEIAITAGIVHDMYNMMSVVFMLPLELATHVLENTSMWMLELFGTNTRTEIGELQFLSYFVKPLVDVVILIDKEAIDNLDPDTILPSNKSLIKRCCNEERIGNTTICHKRCFSLFSHIDFSDNVICILLLIIAMVTLFTCLVFVVKVTKSLLGGRLLNWVAGLASREYKFPFTILVGYLFILVGMVITIILHSSGVFTSMLVPLAGGDVLNLNQIYELTLGSNIGTTTTGILAALSAQSKYPIETLQVALCHFIFNVAGILMFYAFPHTNLPMWASKRFGMLSAKSMWFSVGYLVIVFLIAPTVTLLIYYGTSK